MGWQEEGCRQEAPRQKAHATPPAAHAQEGTSGPRDAAGCSRRREPPEEGSVSADQAGDGRGKARDDFRLVHFSVQRDHAHLIVEACDARALSNGIRALEIRIAHRINRFEKRKGRLFADRYHTHELTTPRETKAALEYVLKNAQHHAQQRGVELPRRWIDPYASCAYFDGWPTSIGRPREPFHERPVASGTVWLLTKGWRRFGPVPFGLPARVG